MTMPNFLIIGAAKSGTSALYAYLRQHPDIFASDIKEPGFFALEGETVPFAGPGAVEGERQRIRHLDQYQALFRRAGSAVAVGESSCIYLFSPEAPRRIRHYVPNVKLIAILRNPVDRAYSGFRYLVRDGREPLGSFEEALEAEPARVAANWEPIWFHAQRGFYAAQLKRYFELFDRGQIRVYTYDEFVASPLGVLRDIYRFLEVDESFAPDLSLRHNVSGTPRSPLLHAVLARPSAVKDAVKSLVPAPLRRRIRRVRSVLMERNIASDGAEMSGETRQSLMQLFRNDILELEGLIDRDLSGWLDASG